MEILYDAFLICKIYPWRVFWCIFIFIAAIWTTGVSIKEEKSDEEENTLIIGFFKIMSKISITLLVLTVSVVLYQATSERYYACFFHKWGRYFLF